MEDSERMKILIAYDGSEGAESAIDDLKRAGLPRHAEAIVMTIAEELIPAPTSIGGVATTFTKNLLEEEKDSLAMARRARSLLQELFPGWEILADAPVGDAQAPMNTNGIATAHAAAFAHTQSAAPVT